MTATDELRRLLDERGVEYRYEDVTEGTLFVVTKDVRIYYILAREKGFKVWSDWLTPEQAIAATLGSGTCHSTTPDDAWCFACSECGKSSPRHKLHLAHNHGEINYCPNCGRRVVEVDK